MTVQVQISKFDRLIILTNSEILAKMKPDMYGPELKCLMYCIINSSFASVIVSNVTSMLHMYQTKWKKHEPRTSRMSK